MTKLRIVAAFDRVAELLATYEAEVPKGGLLARGATLPGAVAPMTPCLLEVKVAGETIATVEARVAAVFPGLGVAVLFDRAPPELARAVEGLRAEARAPTRDPVARPTSAVEALVDPIAEELAEALVDETVTEPPPPDPTAAPEERGAGFQTAAERLAGLTVSQKMQAALGGARDVRLQILRDNLKTLHVYALKNPRIGIDEVLWAAKQPSLSPDALKLVSEHAIWGMNAQICSAIVQNPRTPIPIALKLLPRIPMSDLKQIAKGKGRAQIVQAARKIVIPS